MGLYSPRKWSRYLLLALFLACLVAWWNVESRNSVRTYRTSADQACSDWNPHNPVELDPESCLRAKQFRQIQRLTALEKDDWNHEIYQALIYAQECALGLKTCPERPLILTDWFYLWNGMRGGTSGEEIWMGQVTRAVEEEGFRFMVEIDRKRSIAMSRALSESIHMFWTLDMPAFECITNPRCIRPEDYHPADDPSIRYDVDSIPQNELGKLPLWKIFALTYWGARTTEVGSPGWSARNNWDLADDDKEWSLNPIGRQMIITPYPYPGHSWIPFSMEKECLMAPVIPASERNDSVLILAKRSELFHRDDYGDLLFDSWSDVSAALEDVGHEIWAVAEAQQGRPLPAGIRNFGLQSRRNYQNMLSHVKALVGIGHPEISPSPYVALCRGVPVVMPYRGQNATPDGWFLYDVYLAQHGPMNTLGEPWVYTYRIDDPEDLKAQLLKAISTPIEPIAPGGYSEANMRAQARKVLYHDYHADYLEAIERNGGVVPHHPDKMLRRCLERRDCPMAD